MGCALGFFGGLFGIGGGIIAIPVLGIFFGFQQQAAQGTAIVLVLPTALTGLVQYLRRVSLDWRIVASLAVTALPITVFASRLVTLLPSRPVRYGFVVFLVVLAAYIARRAWMLGRRSPRKPLGLKFAPLLGVFCGLVSGFFSVGGSIFSVPLLTEYFGQTQLLAQATALAFTAPGIILSVAVYALAGDVDWAVGIPLAIGGVSTVAFGVGVAHRLPERMLRFLFVAFVLVCAVALFARAQEV